MASTRGHVYLKACTRCGGDLVPDEDDDLACLQCGRRAATRIIEPDDASRGSSLKVSQAELAVTLRAISTEQVARVA
jgi:DNA-directed RNA polymerase subunit RPC12/RpoP